MTAAVAKDPNNVELVFKLARKSSERYKDELTAKAKELYKKVVALDPEGKKGTTTLEYLKASVPYTEAAVFNLAQMESFGAKPDAAPMKAFIAKYPDSPLAKQAYSYLAMYYRYYGGQDEAGKAEAAKFFEGYTAKYPQDTTALGSYLEFIIKNKEPLDKGIELAEKANEIAGYPQHEEFVKDLAELYVLKGDPGKAEEEYGKDFLDSYLSSTISGLMSYANFWVEQGKNLESAEAAADLMAKLARPDQSYYLSSAAGVFVKLKKPEKALAIYGPEYAAKNAGEANVLMSYAAFWNRQGTNLDSALDAAKKSVALSPDYYNYFVLGNILFKLKRYDEALPAAEKAVELVKPMAVKYPDFPTQQYEGLVKQIKDALGKGKPEPKK